MVNKSVGILRQRAFLKGLRRALLAGFAVFAVNVCTVSAQVKKNYTIIEMGTTSVKYGFNCFVIECPDNSLIVIDGGKSDGNPTNNELRTCIKNHDNHVAAWIISHAHTDHYGEFTSLMSGKNRDGITVDAVYTVPQLREFSPYGTVSDVEKEERLTFWNVLNSFGDKVHYVVEGDVFYVSGLKFTVLNSWDEEAQSEFYDPDRNNNALNNGSMAFRIDSDYNSMLYLADVQKQREEKFLTKYADLIKVDYVQCSHHGIYYNLEYDGMSPDFYKTTGASKAFLPTPKIKSSGSMARAYKLKQALLSYGMQVADFTACDYPANETLRRAGLSSLFNQIVVQPNGASGSAKVQYLKTGTKALAPKCEYTCPGYTFLCWNTKADGTGRSYAAGADLPDGDITLYAKWKFIRFETKAELYGSSGNKVKLSWSKIVKASKYEVKYRTSPKKPFKTWKTIKKNSCSMTGLKRGKTYYFRIVARDSAGKKLAQSKTFKTKTLPVIQVTSIKKSNSGVRVKWKKASSAGGYQVSVSTSASKINIAETLTGSGVTKFNATVPKKKTRYYRVRAFVMVNGKVVYGPWSKAVKYRRK